MKKTINNKIHAVKPLNIDVSKIAEVIEIQEKLSDLENDIMDNLPLEAYLSNDFHVEYNGNGATCNLDKYVKRSQKIEQLEAKIVFKGQTWKGNGKNKAVFIDIYSNPLKYQYRAQVLEGIYNGLDFLDQVEYSIVQKKQKDKDKVRDVENLIKAIKNRNLSKQDKALLIKELS